MVALFLRSEGIPAHVTAHAGATNPLEVGSMQPYRISVLRRDFGRAREILRTPPPSVDWEQVDVGDPEPGDVIPSPPAAHAGHAWKRWFAILILCVIAFAMLGYGAVVMVGLAAIGEIAARIARRARPARSLG